MSNHKEDYRALFIMAVAFIFISICITLTLESVLGPGYEAWSAGFVLVVWAIIWYQYKRYGKRLNERKPTH